MTTKHRLGRPPAAEVERNVRRRVEESLARMRLQRVDPFFLHSNIIPDGYDASAYAESPGDTLDNLSRALHSSLRAAPCRRAASAPGELPGELPASAFRNALGSVGRESLSRRRAMHHQSAAPGELKSSSGRVAPARSKKARPQSPERGNKQEQPCANGQRSDRHEQ